MVLVLFVILYLVVFHLDYYTRMEAHIARVRISDAKIHDGLYSSALLAMSLLIEDLKTDQTESSEQTGGAAVGGGLAGLGGLEGQLPPGLEGVPMQPINAPGLETGPGAAAAAPAMTHYDHIHENLFQVSTQSVGDVTAKMQVHCSDGRLSLNLLFQYAQLVLSGASGAGVAGGAGELPEGVEEGDLLRAVEGQSEADAAENLRDIASRAGRAGRAGGGTGPGAGGRTGTGTGRATRAGDTAAGGEPVLADETAQQLGLQEDVQLTQFEEPSPEILEATQEIVRRAVQIMISINEEWGYLYEQPYNADAVAAGIVEFVLARRRSPVQNIIYDPTELLNVYAVTSELYFGPSVPIHESDDENIVAVVDQWDEMQEFLLRRDEFGDVIADPILGPDYEAEREMQRDQLAQLQEAYGQFADFPGLGLGRMSASSLTRGMSEPAQKYDEDGNGIIIDPPLPIGLDDIFTAFSSGKVNINTAPIPVLFALLLSLEAGADEAHEVALLIHRYRNRTQEYVEEEEAAGGVDRVSSAPNLGQPRRQRPEEDLLDSELTDEELMAQAGSAYEDAETNYFTSLEQIELIDGNDEGPDDLIRSDTGVDRISSEQDSLYRRILNDYRNVMVFGSTYFTVEVKAKTKDSPLVKRGYLVIKRDPQARLMETILWKEVE